MCVTSAVTDFQFGKEDFSVERTHQLLWAADLVSFSSVLLKWWTRFGINVVVKLQFDCSIE